MIVVTQGSGEVWLLPWSTSTKHFVELHALSPGLRGFSPASPASSRTAITSDVIAVICDSKSPAEVNVHGCLFHLSLCGPVMEQWPVQDAPRLSHSTSWGSFLASCDPEQFEAGIENEWMGVAYHMDTLYHITTAQIGLIIIVQLYFCLLGFVLYLMMWKCILAASCLFRTCFFCSVLCLVMSCCFLLWQAGVRVWTHCPEEG